MDRYAVIGNPIAHSKSPWIHTEFARQTAQAMQYEAILGPEHGFADTVRAFAASEGRGMNVTVPFKLDAYDLAEHLRITSYNVCYTKLLRIAGIAKGGDRADRGADRPLRHAADPDRQLPGRLLRHLAGRAP